MTEQSTSKSITISGKPFNVPLRYELGHTLDSEGEVNALNQTFHEAIRNNLASKFDENLDDLTQTVVDDYAEKYEFGVRTGGGGRIGDPIEREAIRLSSEKVREAIRGNPSAKLADYKTADITALAKKLMTKQPAFLQMAKDNVARQQQVAAATLADLGL